MTRTFRERWPGIFSRAILLSALVVGCCPQRVVHAGTDTARVVKYAKEDIVPVNAKVRFSTLIVLPDDEEILDFTTGDKDFWIINGAHNLCYVHPAQAGIRTNLNLITASGHVYSFVLNEVSNTPSAEPDLKIFVEPKDTSGIDAAGAIRGYVRSGEVDAYKSELEALRTETASQLRAAQDAASARIETFRSTYAAKLRFDYLFNKKAGADPFLVSAIFHDDKFTYIRCAAREKPALYELKDGKPNLISFQVEDGVYIAPKVLDAGYLAVGKKKLPFTRRASGN